MRNENKQLEEELARWHWFSNGAIGDKYALLTLFLATVPPELKDLLREAIMEELGKCYSTEPSGKSFSI